MFLVGSLLLHQWSTLVAPTTAWWVMLFALVVIAQDGSRDNLLDVNFFVSCALFYLGLMTGLADSFLRIVIRSLKMVFIVDPGHIRIPYNWSLRLHLAMTAATEWSKMNLDIQTPYFHLISTSWPSTYKLLLVLVGYQQPGPQKKYSVLPHP